MGIRVIRFILFVLIVAVFGSYADFWNENTIKFKEDNTSIYNTLSILEYPFKEYRSYQLKRELNFPKPLHNQKAKYLFVLDKTGSIEKNDSEIAKLNESIIRNRSGKLCPSKYEMFLDKDIDERDRHLLLTVAEIQNMYPEGFDLQCYYYYGGKYLIPLIELESNKLFKEITEDNICGQLNSIRQTVKKFDSTYYSLKLETNLSFVFRELSKPVFGNKGNTFNVFSLISDFDHEPPISGKMPSIGLNQEFSGWVDGFLEANRLDRVSIYKLSGINKNTPNQETYFNNFKKHLIDNIYNSTTDIHCKYTGNYNDYQNSLRKVIAGNDIDFSYPIFDNNDLTIASCKVSVPRNLDGRVYLTNLKSDVISETPYVKFMPKGRKARMNEVISIEMTALEQAEIKLYDFDESEAKNYFLFVNPSDSNYTYKYRIVPKRFLPKLSAILLQVAYFEILVLGVFVCLWFAVCSFRHSVVGKVAQATGDNLLTKPGYFSFGLASFLALIIFIRFLSKVVFYSIPLSCFFLGVTFTCIALLMLSYRIK